MFENNHLVLHRHDHILGNKSIVHYSVKLKNFLQYQSALGSKMQVSLFESEHCVITITVIMMHEVVFNRNNALVESVKKY